MSEYKPQVGDRVRVTTTTVAEGVVVIVESDEWFRLDTGTRYSVTVPTSRDIRQERTVELIERRRPKVGDVVEGQDAYDALPVGSLVKDLYGLLFKTRQGWADNKGHISVRISVRRTVVYLPPDDGGPR